MKTAALVSLYLITGLVGAALVSFRLTDSAARSAGHELEAFREQAWAAAQKKRIFPVSPAGYVVSMTPPTLSPSDRARIDALEQRYESLRYRHAQSDWLFTRGAVVAAALAGLCWFLMRSNQSREPALRT